MGDEVELGLRLLGEDQVRRMLGTPDLRRRVREAPDSQEAMINEMQNVDPEVESIVRVLRAGGRHDRKSSKEDKDKEKNRRRHSSHADGADGGGRRRSRSRRQRHAEELEGGGHSNRNGDTEKHSHRHRHHRHRHERTAPDAAEPRSGGKEKSSRKHGEPGSEKTSRRQSDQRGTARGGVWGSPGRDGEQVGPEGGAGGGRLAGAASAVNPAAGAVMEEWIKSLDGGRGAMVRYLEPLRREFGDLNALAATVLPKQTGGSVVGWIDASLWDALGVTALGHKLTLAKGIVALSKQHAGTSG